MVTIGKYLALLLVVGAFTLWVARAVDWHVFAHAGTQTLATPTLALATTTRAYPGDGYAELSGVVLMDTHGKPSVPYIQYIENGRTKTKQLVFVNERACSPNAGDYPCVGLDPAAAYPKVEQGEHIHVRGELLADRFLVYDYTPE